MNKAPPYAVTNANPSLGQILGNMRTSDLLQWGAFVAVSGPFGYVVGESPPAPPPSGAQSCL
jgi:hypothetical protein